MVTPNSGMDSTVDVGPSSGGVERGLRQPQPSLRRRRGCLTRRRFFQPASERNYRKVLESLPSPISQYGMHLGRARPRRKSCTTCACEHFCIFQPLGWRMPSLRRACIVPRIMTMRALRRPTGYPFSRPQRPGPYVPVTSLGGLAVVTLLEPPGGVSRHARS